MMSQVHEMHVHSEMVHGTELIAQAILLLSEAERCFVRADDYRDADVMRRIQFQLEGIDTGYGD